YGENTSTIGTTYGIYAKNNSTTGFGLYVLNTATTGANYSIFAANNSTTGKGIGTRCYSTTGVTYGVVGANNSTDGYGVYGTADATSGTNYGVYGRSMSTTGFGVYGTSRLVGIYGIATATTGNNYGVLGKTNSPDGAGVWGEGPEAGVVGIQTGGGSAGLFYGHVLVQGDQHVTGTLYKSAGSFKIDHPLDPENKYLYHSFVESPDRMNIYNGNITLNSNGEAIIQLPDWFEALNNEFRYQLTAIGAPGPNLYIAQEVKNNSFTIAGGTSGMKISWQVTGIRKDAYALKNPMAVEEEKNGEDRGKYLNPEAFGKSKEEGIGFSFLQKLRPKVIQQNEDLLLPEQNLNGLSPESINSVDIK
ncbi:MAG: hypothetical protein Q8M94_19160, partial [Ignavibacteria bacterium]|nr:hypothetical protein [Ignavibacteria bacterium]